MTTVVSPFKIFYFNWVGGEDHIICTYCIIALFSISNSDCMHLSCFLCGKQGHFQVIPIFGYWRKTHVERQLLVSLLYMVGIFYFIQETLKRNTDKGRLVFQLSHYYNIKIMLNRGLFHFCLRSLSFGGLFYLYIIVFEGSGIKCYKHTPASFS